MKLVSQPVQQAAENVVTLKPLLVSLDVTLAELNIKRMACQVEIFDLSYFPISSFRYSLWHFGHML